MREPCGLMREPCYAPEHNPDEFLNNDLKQAMARRRTPRDKAALKSGLTSQGSRIRDQRLNIMQSSATSKLSVLEIAPVSKPRRVVVGRASLSERFDA